MIKLRRRSALVAAVVAASSLALSSIPAEALSIRSETGVTSTSVKLGITLPMTGAAAPGYNKIPGAMNAYFSYVNDNGGVNGRKISLVVKNDEYLPQLAIAKTNELILKDKVFAIVGALGTANNRAVAIKVNPGRRGVPNLFVNTGFSGFANDKVYPTTYSLFPSYIMEAKVMGQYIKENFADKKIGLIVQDDDFGDDAMAGFKAAGVTFAATKTYASGSQAAGLATQVAAMQKAECDVVIMFGVTTASAAALGASIALKYKPQWILGSVGGDGTTLKAANVPVGLLYGALGASFLPSTADDKDEYVSLFKTINAKYNKGVTFDNNVLAGMNTAFVTVQALQAAGRNLTRKGLMNAIELEGSSFASAGLSPLLYSTSSHAGYSGYWIGKYDPTGNLLPIDGKYKVYTTDSGSGDVVASSYTRPAMPTNGLPK